MSPPSPRGPSRTSLPNESNEPTETTENLGTDAREELFTTLFEATYDDVRRFVRRRVDDEAVDDAVSETFLVAWRRLEIMPAEHEARLAWLYATARRILANQRRGRHRRDALALRLSEQPTQPVEGGGDPAAVIHRVDVGRAFARLGPRDQEVLALIVWDGLSKSAAAAVLEISVAAFDARLRRARRRLRAQLDPTPEGARS